MPMDMTVSEGFAVTEFAKTIGVKRDEILVAFLKARSYFQDNRSAYEIARQYVLNGEPPTDREALANFAKVMGGVLSIHTLAVGLSAGIFADFGSSAAAVLGFATTGVVPMILGLGLAALFVVLIYEATLTVRGFLSGMIEGIQQKIERDF